MLSRRMGRRSLRTDAPRRYCEPMGLDRRWWALIAICGATFMLLVDMTIVQVALPRIQSDLHASFTEPAVGDRRLRADDVGADPDERRARRPGRTQARVPRRRERVHARLAGVRAVEQRHDADRRPRRAGVRRSGDVRHLAGADRAGVPGARAWRGDRRLGRHGGRCGRGRPAGRRDPHRRARLAVDLLRQPADRNRHDRDVEYAAW